LGDRLALPETELQEEPGDSDPVWLRSFHAGDRATLEACYRMHFATVQRAVGRHLTGADQETAIHEVFSRLIARTDLRQNFRGGSFAAWIATLASNHAIDIRRRSGREQAWSEAASTSGQAESWESALQARMLVARFRSECLPADWQGIFELRFLEQLPQREVARRLALHRTTLAYRELRIRALLKRFLLKEDEP
jgi:RNA polymerase sigma-70 factor (ECF subfamily)